MHTAAFLLAIYRRLIVAFLAGMQRRFIYHNRTMRNLVEYIRMYGQYGCKCDGLCCELTSHYERRIVSHDSNLVGTTSSILPIDCICSSSTLLLLFANPRFPVLRAPLHFPAHRISELSLRAK